MIGTAPVPYSCFSPLRRHSPPSWPSPHHSSGSTRGRRATKPRPAPPALPGHTRRWTAPRVSRWAIEQTRTCVPPAFDGAFIVSLIATAGVADDPCVGVDDPLRLQDTVGA